jgi:hypothetical protein
VTEHAADAEKKEENGCCFDKQLRRSFGATSINISNEEERSCS